MSMQPEESSPASRGDRQMVLMFTDILDSVAIKRQIGDLAYVEALNSHLKRLAAAITAEPGASVIKSTGDGLLARFQTPGDAVRAALRIQAGGGAGFQPADSAEENAAKMAAPPRSLPDRIGIHAGVGIETTDPSSGKPDVAGLAVDMAARVMGLCEPGQILLTRAAFDDARQFVREHPGGCEVGRSAPPPTTVDEGGKPSVVGEGAHRPAVTWMAHGPYLFKGAEDDPLEVFEVGGAGIAPLKAPRDSEKARRAVAPGEEAMYDWRPAVGLEVPRKANWLLERKLGEGGFGEVWLAKQRKTGDQRVFKFCFDADRLRSFRRELTLFRLLREALGDRRDIARIFDVSLEHAPFSLESEYSPGGDLYDWADRQGGIGTLPLATRLDLLRRVAEAVAAAHSVGILHKDLKPSNILMDTAEDGSPRPKLADFGIGVLADRSRLEGAGFTIGGFTMGGGATLTQNDSSRTGTRLYSPPESMTNVRTTDGGEAKAAPFTAKGDVFALGVMLYQFVIGDLDRPLAQGWERNVEGAVGSVGVASSRPSSTSSQGPQGKEGRQDATPTSAADPHLLAILKADIAEMTDGDPDRRVASAAEVARRLASVEERRGQLQRESEVQQATARAEARNRKLKLVAGVAVGVLLLLTVVGSYAIYSINQERETASAALADKVKAEEQRAEAEGRADAIWDGLRKHRLEQIDNAMSALAASPLSSAVEAARTAREAITEDSWSPIPPMQLMELREATHQLLESVMLAENLLHLQTDMIGNRPAEILTLEQEWQSLTEIWNARSESIRLALATREFGLAMSIYQAAEAEMTRRFSAFDSMERMQQVESWRESAPQVAMEAAQRLAAVGESIVRAQGRQLRWRRERIQTALEDVRLGLSRADRPRDAPFLDDYMFELVGYRDLQTVELLAEELKQHAIKAGWVAEDKPEPKEVLWTQEERDLITLCCRVLGRIGLGKEAVVALTPVSQVMIDHTLVVQIGMALGNTRSVTAWEPLLAMRGRLTTLSDHPMLSTYRQLPPIPLPEPNPNDAMAFHNRGLARRDSGDLPGAIEDYTRAIELDPNYSLAFSNRGNARHQSGDLPGAIQDYSRAIELDPNHVNAFSNRGAARRVSGDLPGAIEDYTRAIELDPNHAMAFSNRGNARQRSGDLPGAILDFNRSIELNPNHAMAFSNRGGARRASGDLAGAIEDFTRAIELDPNDAFAYANRGLVRQSAGEFDMALADFEKAAELMPRHATIAQWRDELRGLVALKAWLTQAASTPAEHFTKAQAHAAFAKGDTLAAELAVAEAEYKKGSAGLGDSAPAELQTAAANTADQLGTAFYTAKLYPKSVEWYAKALALRQHLPNPADTAYNGACAAALAGQEMVGEGTQPPNEGEVGGDAHPPKFFIDKAFEWLALAAELGYSNAEHAGKDPDLTSLHQDPRWEPTIERTRKNAAPEPKGE